MSACAESRLEAAATSRSRGLTDTIRQLIGTGAPRQIRTWTRADAAGRQADLRLRLRHVLGLNPWPSRTPLAAQQVGEIRRDGYTVEKHLIQSRPGFYVPLNLYLPHSLTAPTAAVLNPHGHFPDGKAGGADPPIHPVGTVQPRLIGLARLGFVALSLDGIGWGERRRVRADCGHWKLSPLLGGGCIMGMQVWDNIRALDFLLSRPEVDAERVGITGCSGGGTQSLLTAAVDERFRAVVPVCFGTELRHWFLRELGISAGACLCHWIPGLARIAELADLCALLAPRPTLLLCASRDGNATEGVERAFPEIRRAFELLDAPDRLQMAVVPGEHGYFKPLRERMYAFFLRVLLEGKEVGGTVEEEPLQCERTADLDCFYAELPGDLKTVDDIVESEQERLFEAEDDLPDTAEELARYRQRFRRRLADEVLGGFPEREDPCVSASSPGEGGFQQLEFVSSGALRVTGYLYVPESTAEKVNLIVDSRGAHNGIYSYRARRILGKGFPEAILAIDCQNWGSQYDPEAQHYDEVEWGAHMWLLLAGRPLMGLRVWDAIRAVDVIGDHPRLKGVPIEVAGHGEAGLVALLAGALDDRIDRICVADVPASFRARGSGYGQRAYATYPSAQAQPLGFFLPGILKLGDMAQIMALAAPRYLGVKRPTTARRVALEPEEVEAPFRFTRKAYELLGAEDRFEVSA